MRPYARHGSPRESQVRHRRMVDYLKSNFAEVLGADVELLDEPDGLHILYTKYFRSASRSSRRRAA